MDHVSTKQIISVWIFLVIASLGTVWLAENNNWFGEWTIPFVLGVAVLKARSIVLYYMEIKFAPWQLKLPFEAWVAISFGVIVGFWFIS